MSDPLHFMMGKFRAEFPTDRLYARNHMWAQRAKFRVPGSEFRVEDSEFSVAESESPAPPANDVYRFGFAAYAVRLLQDVYFLDWTVDPGTTLEAKQEIGAIESSKAEASLYSPMAGRLVELNEAVLRDPSAVNVDKYGAGWLFAIQGDGRDLLSPAEYLEHLDAVWEVTQRTIKGQMNE